MAVAVVDAEGVNVGGCGVDETTEFEVGSISKPILGMAIAELVSRDELSLDTTLGELDPRITGVVAKVTVEQVITHSSGLPRLGWSGPEWAWVIVRIQAGFGVPEEDAERLFARASRISELGTEPEYSNFAVDILGHALAHSRGVTYSKLLKDLVFKPLQMNNTFVSSSARSVADHGYTGYMERGARVSTKVEIPSGGVVSTRDDMVKLLLALVYSRGPGAQSYEPRQDLQGGARIGYHWLTDAGPETKSPITWHNGSTPGYSSFIGASRDKKFGVLVMADHSDAELTQTSLNTLRTGKWK